MAPTYDLQGLDLHLLGSPNMIRRAFLLLLPLLLIPVAACGDDDGAGTASASGSASGSMAASGSGSASGSVASDAGDCEVVDGVDADEDSEIHATLSEYAIDVEEDGAEAGVIKFEATNDGDVAHELVVLKAKKADIEVDEDGAPLETGLVGEIEAFAPGTECQGSFELEAGTYTLLCAIVEESGESHFMEGMATELEVK
jgi:hypothetical protein